MTKLFNKKNLCVFGVIVFLININTVFAQAQMSTVRNSASLKTNNLSDSGMANAELAKQLSSYQSYQADFSQVTYDRAGKVMEQSQGTIKIERPGKFRWETLRPNKQLIIANDNTLWVYDVDLAQASRQTLRQQGLSPAVLLSTSVQGLAQKFTVRILQNQWFELLPKQKSANFPLVRLQFNGNELISMQMINVLGQNSVFYFKNIKVNKTIPPQQFLFIPPRGVDVLAT